MRHIRPDPEIQAPIGRLVFLSLALLVASCGGGGGGGSSMPLGNDASLSSLSISTATLEPVFSSSVTDYTAAVGFATNSTQVIATPGDASATVRVNGAAVASGVASDPVPLNEGNNTITVNVVAENGNTARTYTLVVTRQSASEFARIAYVKASNTDANDVFGKSVALSGDGETLAVGAPNEQSAATGVDGDDNDNSADYAGAVYVFIRDSSGAWSQQAYITASNTDLGDFFGQSVALSADGATLAVGATGEDSAATGAYGDETDNTAGASGAVYVFTRDSEGVWTQHAYLKASNTDGRDFFGQSVALSGDGATLVAGARSEGSSATGVNGDETDNTASHAGAAYVFTRDSGGVWTQQAYIKASNTDSGDWFGHSVALSADGTTLAVGADWEDSRATGVNGDETDNGGLAPGAAYVFTRGSGGVWAQQAYIKASNTDMYDDLDERGDGFGIDVALSADGTTLAVGAVLEDSSATGVNGDETDNSAREAGAVYVFTRDSGGIWTQQAYVKASDTAAQDLFGVRVALSADGSMLAVGSFTYGAVYVFTCDASGVWTQRTVLYASDIAGRVALSADGVTLVLGALGEDSAATGINGDEGNNTALDSGAVYIFEL